MFKYYILFFDRYPHGNLWSNEVQLEEFVIENISTIF